MSWRRDMQWAELKARGDMRCNDGEKWNDLKT